MTANDLLAELASRMKLPALKLDDNRACQLKFDQRLSVNVEAPEGSGALHLFGVVGPIPHDGREAFYEQLLEANLPSTEPPGATCAVDAGSGEVLLCRSFILEQTGIEDLVNGFESFLNELEAWQERLATSAHSTSDRGDSTAAPSGFMPV